MLPTKAQLRAEILASRRSASPQILAAEADALASHLIQLVESGQTLCAYVPISSEPGSVKLIDVLVHRNVVVLLPIARRSPDGTPSPLRWGRYRPGELVRAPFGLHEPAQPWLPAHTIAEAVAVVVPALAVDRRGVRLGRGAGFYDRTLPMADASAALVAVVRDDEFVDRLPSESHDVRMTHVATPHGGVVALGS